MSDTTEGQKNESAAQRNGYDLAITAVAATFAPPFQPVLLFTEEQIYLITFWTHFCHFWRARRESSSQVHFVSFDLLVAFYFF